MDEETRHILQNDDLYEAEQLVGQYQFRLAAVPACPIIYVSIYRSLDNDHPYRFSTSHFLHTPVQASPYITTASSRSSVPAALAAAVETMTSFVGDAVRQGHEPSAHWLVANDNYR